MAKEQPDYSKYSNQASWEAAFSNLKGLQKKHKKIFDKVIGNIYSISDPDDDDITYIVNKTNDHSKIFDRFDSFYYNPDWMKKFGNVNESTTKMKPISLLENVSIINEASPDKKTKVKENLSAALSDFENAMSDLKSKASKLASAANEGKYGTDPEFGKLAEEAYNHASGNILYNYDQMKNAVSGIKKVISKM